MRSDLSDEDLHFARRLKGRRLAANLSRQSLAELTQRSQATIKLIEKGGTKPTVSTIAHFLQVTKLGLTLDDVPLLLREQVSDVLEPRVSVREAPRHPPTVCGHAPAESWRRSSARRRLARSPFCSRCRG